MHRKIKTSNSVFSGKRYFKRFKISFSDFARKVFSSQRSGHLRLNLGENGWRGIRSLSLLKPTLETQNVIV
jgi:hypothetical protein